MTQSTSAIDAPRAANLLQSDNVTILLSHREKELASILEFDPEAALSPGALPLHSDRAVASPVPVDSFSPSTWLRLSRGAADPDVPCDADVCLTRFLLQRAVA